MCVLSPTSILYCSTDGGGGGKNCTFPIIDFTNSHPILIKRSEIIRLIFLLYWKNVLLTWANFVFWQRQWMRCVQQLLRRCTVGTTQWYYVESVAGWGGISTTTALYTRAPCMLCVRGCNIAFTVWAGAEHCRYRGRQSNIR